MSGDGMFDRLHDRLGEDHTDSPLTLSDLLDFPDDERAVVRHIMRAKHPERAHEVAAGLGLSTEEFARIVGSLSMRGVVITVDGCLRIAPMQSNARVNPGGVWGKLGDL
ncbi:unannotated protein [freshwater metagenome]|uniref:Unannotated protein n=1 Tax=freshwater metagenome TaxID=449393 RepID=A0A6J7C4Y7_9ZZZZ